ncbi:MAG: hypothetical protein LBG50_01920, partial [Clostridiales Family XIII bacterium]|nr:hypothetical protein [Clostridiales Family XIII bacterium]
MPDTLFISPEELKRPGAISFRDIPVNQYEGSVRSERSAIGDESLVRLYRDMSILREFESMLNRIKTQGNYNGVEI